MTDLLRNIDCFVLEVYKYTRSSTFPTLDLIRNGIVCISLGEIWFDNNLEGKWVFIYINNLFWVCL